MYHATGNEVQDELADLLVSLESASLRADRLVVTDVRDVLRDWWGFTAHAYSGSTPGAWDASYKTDDGRRHIRAFGTTVRVWEEDGERVTWQEVSPRDNATKAIASFVS